MRLPKLFVAQFVLSALPLVVLPVAQAQAPAAVKAPASKAHVLSVAELDTLLAQPDKALILDVRRPDEITSIGGFPAYLSIQLGDLDKSLAFIPKDRIIVTVSNHAARAGKAADLLASKGFNVAGAIGAQTYEQQGGKNLIHIAPQAPQTQGGGKDGSK